MFNFLKRWFGGNATAYEPGTGRIVAVTNSTGSGITITPDTALTIPAFFHGVRLIAQTIGSQHFDLIEHLGEQLGQRVARTHPVHKLLHDEPNEFQNPSEWRETLIGHAIGWGNGYAYIERNGNFRPTALLPLLPDRTRPQIKDGRLSYVTAINNEPVEHEPYNVFHLKGFSLNGVSGVPLVMLMRDTLGLSKAEEEFAARFFGGGANMGGVMTVPGALSDQARQNLKTSMEREYTGIGNAFRILFLEEGAKFTPTTVNPEAAQAIEARQFQLAEIARVIGVPPHLLYDLSRSTNNNIEHQGIEAVTYAFKPWANKLEQEANRKLLYESEKDLFSTRLDLTPLMAGDATSQANADKANFDMLALTPNERRAKLGLNPIAGGDQLYINTAYLPLNIAMQKALAEIAASEAAAPPSPEDEAEIEAAEAEGQDTAPEEDETPPADPTAGISDPDGAPGPAAPAPLVEELDRVAILKPLVRDTISRIIRREAKAVEAAATKHLGAGDEGAFRAWFDGWEQQQRQHLADAMQPVSEAMTAARLKFNADYYVAQHLDESRHQIVAMLSADRLSRADALSTILADWQKERTARVTNDILEAA